MKRGHGRPEKVGDQIHRELSDLVKNEVRDPRVGMVTITSVDVSPDLSHAKVFVTVLDKQSLEGTLEGLKRSAGYLRSQLSRRMKLYTTPELRFVHDDSVERGAHLSSLIDNLKPKA